MGVNVHSLHDFTTSIYAMSALYARSLPRKTWQISSANEHRMRGICFFQRPVSLSNGVGRKFNIHTPPPITQTSPDTYPIFNNHRNSHRLKLSFRKRVHVIPMYTRQSDVRKLGHVVPMFTRQSDVRKRDYVVPMYTRQSDVRKRDHVVPIFTRQSDVRKLGHVVPKFTRQSDVGENESPSYKPQATSPNLSIFMNINNIWKENRKLSIG